MSLIDEIQTVGRAELADAHAFPFEAYTDPAVFNAERAHIFSKEWVFVCMEPELATPGQYFALDLAGEPILILRGEDHVLRAFSNTCRHRGTPLVDEGFGQIDKHVVCPYHAWAYDTQGELKAIPFNREIAVDRSEHALITFRVETWNGLVFVNLDPTAIPLRDRLQGIDAYLHLFEPHTFEHVSRGTEELWQANWKLAIENAVESYHLFKVHEQTLEQFSPTRDAYYIAGNSNWALTGGATKRRQGLLERLFSGDHDERFEHYILISIPPSFVGILSYGSLGWLSAHPMDANRSTIRSGSLGTKDTINSNSQNLDFTTAFFKEDQDICERVHRGMRAEYGRGGKLVDMERIVTDFHRFVAGRLGGQTAEVLDVFEDNAAERWRA